MKRRESLKALAISGLSAGVLLDACKPTSAPSAIVDAATPTYDRFPEEAAHDEQLKKETFFTTSEMATITLLADIIIPKDEISDSASEAGVPDFIEFIVKDQPYHQVPMRGGLRWLDIYCLRKFNAPFANCTPSQQIEVVDQIAYPAKAAPEMQQGVAFFNLMRDLTASGFYTTAIGFKDIGYVGNQPNQWNGVPDDVLKQYGLSYTEKELKECISF